MAPWDQQLPVGTGGEHLAGPAANRGLSGGGR
jgi:hypothetical protein